MVFNLIAVVVLGVACVAVVMMAFRVFGRKPPRWLLPITAGVAMMSYTLYNDYSWFSRTAGALPETVVLAGAYEQSHPLQPWTYLFAPVDRFAAVDRARLVESPQKPSLVLAEVAMIQRYMPTRVAQMVFDCERGRRSDSIDVEGFDENGDPIGVRWVDVPTDDPLRLAVCAARGRATS